jgi:hypothetical protein
VNASFYYSLRFSRECKTISEAEAYLDGLKKFSEISKQVMPELTIDLTREGLFFVSHPLAVAEMNNICMKLAEGLAKSL